MLKVAVRDGFEKVKNGAKVGEKSLAGYWQGKMYAIALLACASVFCE